MKVAQPIDLDDRHGMLLNKYSARPNDGGSTDYSTIPPVLPGAVEWIDDDSIVPPVRARDVEWIDDDKFDFEPSADIINDIHNIQNLLNDFFKLAKDLEYANKAVGSGTDIVSHPDVKRLVELIALEAFKLAGECRLDVGKLIGNLSFSSEVTSPIIPVHVDAVAVRKVEIATFTKKEDDLRDPKRAAAIEKLLKLSGKIEYQRARGRSALPVDVWLTRTLVEPGKLHVEELALIPMWAFLKFDRRLYQALMDKRRSGPR